MKKHIILFFIILQTVLISTAAYAAENNTARDEAVDAVVSMELMKNMEDGEFHPEFNINRGEMAELIYNIYNPFGENIAYEPADISGYRDMKDSGYENAVKFAVGMGIMTGYDNNTFAPDENISYAQALKIFVSILGYGEAAEKSGGYPLGYIEFANQIGLCKNIEADFNGYINRGTIALLTFRTIKTDMMSVDKDVKSISYYTKDGDTLWNRYYGIVYDEGSITADYLTSLVSSVPVQSGSIQIDHKNFFLGSCRYDTDWLGRKASYFYNYDDETLVYVGLKDYDEKDEITLQGDDIVSCENNVYTYYNASGQKKSKSFEKTANVIYNGRFTDKQTNDVYIPKDGYVQLIDTDRDGRYDLLKITNYTTIIVNGYSFDKCTLTDKYDSNKNLSFDDNDTDYVLLTDSTGKQTDPDSLQEYDVLTVTVSEDKRIIRGAMARNKTAMTLEAVKTSADGNDICVFDGKEYKTVNGYYSYKQISGLTGTSITVCMDVNGRIAAVIGAEKTKSFVYIYSIETADNDKDPDKPLLILKTMDENGSYKKESISERLTVDGKKFKKAYDAYNAFFIGGDKIVPCLSTIVRDSDGNIIDIDTPYFNTEVESKEDSLQVLYSSYDDDHKLIADRKLRYMQTTQTFGGRVSVPGDIKIFCVPSDKTEELTVWNSKIKDKGFIGNEQDIAFEAYKVEESYGNAAVLVMYDRINGSGIDTTINLALVDDVSLVYDEEQGDSVYQISYMLDGGRKKVSCISGYDASEIGSGDIVRFMLDADGYITAYNIFYDYDKDTVINDTSDDFFSEDMTQIGYVYSKFGEFINISKDLKTMTAAAKYEDIIDKLKQYKGTAFRIYKYDTQAKSDNITMASTDDLMDYIHYGEGCSKVFVHTRYGNARLLVIYQ